MSNQFQEANDALNNAPVPTEGRYIMDNQGNVHGPTQSIQEELRAILDNLRSEINDQPGEARSWEWDEVYKRHEAAVDQAIASLTSLITREVKAELIQTGSNSLLAVQAFDGHFHTPEPMVRLSYINNRIEHHKTPTPGGSDND